MQLTTDKIIEVFYLVDEFCQAFTKSFDAHLIGNKPKKTPKMSDSEVITILTLFHLGNFLCLDAKIIDTTNSQDFQKGKM